MPTRWEYMVMDSHVTGFFEPEVDAAGLTSRLNELGAEGWEVVGMTSLERARGRTRDVVILLKRARA